MSTMLEQAIIDATALKEAARASAEEKIIEHFSNDIKDAINTILEQDEMGALGALAGGLAAAPVDPLAASPTIDVDASALGKDTFQGESIVEQTPYAATTSNNEFVSIDLDKLEESIREQLNEDEPRAERADVDKYEYEKGKKAGEKEELDEEYEVELEGVDTDAGVIEEVLPTISEDEDDGTLEEMIRNALAEEFLSEDESRPERAAVDKYEYEEGKEAGEKEEKEEEETTNEAILREKNLLTYMYNEQYQNNEKLIEKINKYRTLIQHLNEEVQRVNLSNAKLLYQNRVLDSDSLNERQKDRIVETITNANTVEEAKIIYETLQSAVGANAQARKPKSLNEVVTKRSSAFVPRKEEKREDPLYGKNESSCRNN